MQEEIEPKESTKLESKSSTSLLTRVLSGSVWLAIKTPIAAVIAFWTIPLMIRTYGDGPFGAYGFAWGFGFFQMLLEFGMSSALQRQVVTAWSRGDREAVSRSLGSGMVFYTVMALVQAALLLAVAYLAVPYTDYTVAEKSLIVKLLWLQVITSPCWGFSTVISSILQAAHRYEVIPRFEVLVVLCRFLVLVAGVSLGWSLILVASLQTFTQIFLTLGPAIWIAVAEFGMFPRFRDASWQEFKSMIPMSMWVFLIQLSVILADKLDTTVLGFVLSDPAPATSIYQVVSKPFMQVRQTGWMLAYFVMPAAASLAAAKDIKGLDHVKYDGVRLHFSLLLPVGLLAGIYARPFLYLWVGPDKAQYAHLMQLFLLATLPLVMSVPVQVAIGLGHVRVIGLAGMAGAVVNLPLSYFLTLKLGVSGVIWGTVLTTFFSNLIIPGIYVFRNLEIRPVEFFRRSLGAGLSGSLMMCVGLLGINLIWDVNAPNSTWSMKLVFLMMHICIGLLIYATGYFLNYWGKKDREWILSKVRNRRH